MSAPVIIHGPQAVINRFSSNKPNAQVPFLQGVPNSMVSPEWYRFLTNVDQAVYGTSGSTTVNNITTLPDLQISSEMTDAVEENELAIQAQTDAQAAQLIASGAADGEGLSTVQEALDARLSPEADDITGLAHASDVLAAYTLAL